MRSSICLFAAACLLSCAANSGSKPAVAAQAANPAPVAAPAPSPAAPIASMPDPAWLPSEAREMLVSRMERHGEEMMLMLVSVMTLQHEDTELLAEHVASEPRLGRPAPNERDTINALLPARFFELQDQLLLRANALSTAAKSKDDARVVHAYGQLAETCVACHSVYLSPDRPFEMPGD